MSGETARLKLAELPEGQAMNAAQINTALGQIDALVDCCLKGVFVNAPPASASDGDIYLVGGSPGGDWGADFTYKLAYRRDGAWEPVMPFDGLRAFVPATGAFLVYCDGLWTDWNALISTAESSIAAAAVCDIGAAGSLFLDVTGTAAITSLGAAPNKLRFLRFAGSLTLTHNPASLILPGGANIVTAAGDTALFASDAAGNWRCRHYSRANGQPVAAELAASSFSPLGGGFAAGKLYYSSGDGVVLAGKTGSSHDLVLAGASGAGVLEVPTGTADAVFPSRVGINAAPTSPLTIASDGVATDAVSMINTHAGAKNWKFGVGTGGFSFGFYQASDGIIAGGFGGDGSLLVGTIQNGGWTGDSKLAVVGAGHVISTQVTGNGSAFASRCDNTGAWFAGFYFGSASVGSISPSGTAGVAYNTTSDARLKAVCARQRDYRGAIQALWVGDFTWKENGAPGFGVLAQQAYDVMPNHQGVTRPADAAGLWHASAEPFAHLALWGVKDLYALVEALAARVAALEATHEAG